MAIPWLPLITLGTSLLGGLIGNDTKQTQSEDSTTVGATTQATEQNSEMTGTKTGTTNQVSTDTTTGQQSEVVNRLDSTTLASLTDGVRAMLQDAGKGSTALQAEIDRISGGGSSFDPNQFVSGIMASARAENDAAMEAGGNRIMTRTGTSVGSNSAAALLDAKLKRQGAANLAGIQSNANATAESILRDNETSRTGALTALSSGKTNELSTMLTSLLNATQQSTGTNTQTGTGTTTGTTAETSKEVGKQTQEQAGTTQQTTKSNISSNKNEGSLGTALSGLGDVFKARF